jgi:mRNA interferase HigB
MRVVGKGIIDAAIRKHGNLAGPLGSWWKIANEQTWTCLNDIRKTWPKTDEHDGWFIFDIKGRRFRLIATINFRSLLLEVRHVLTHAEYDKGDWK